MRNSTSRLKYEVISIDYVDITADVSLLNQDIIWFNATEIAKRFNKQPSDFLRLDSTKEYVGEILKESGTGNSPNEKFGSIDDLVRIMKGGKYQGSWLHKELAFEFAGWCSPVFRRKLHKWTEERLIEEHNRQQERLKLKTGYLPMTKAIQAAHNDPKPYHFSNECDLVNRIVTGMTASKFKEAHSVNSVRDALTAAQAQLMDKLQRQNASLIELGFDYEARKKLLQQQVDIALGLPECLEGAS